ncbi:MAG: MBL fold metallo-hydrolase [Treponema sp.]|nr:MBL fold metallo-hydrolase [Treponema sp.]
MAKQHIIKFTGIGSAFNPAFGNTSAYFIKGETLVLLDCGETVFMRIQKLAASKRIKRIIVILTHMHSDHIGSLGTLISYCFYVMHKPVEVLYPAKIVNRFLQSAGIREGQYTYYHAAPKTWGFSVVPHKVFHVEGMACFGYEISLNNTTFYYSGDADDIPDKVLERFLNNDIDVLFHETTLDKNTKEHCPYTTLEQKIPFAERKRVYCMHLASSACITVLKKKGFQIPDVV